MTKPTIILDCDGILADLSTVWFRWHNEDCTVCTKPLLLENVLAWDTSQFTECGRDVYKYLNMPGMWLSLLPIPGSQAGVYELQKFANVVVVTTITAGKEVRDVRAKWLRYYFPTVRDIVITDTKSVVRADFIFDDGLHNLFEHNAHGLLMDCPYNRWSHAFPRVAHWDEALAYMQRYFIRSS